MITTPQSLPMPIKKKVLMQIIISSISERRRRKKITSDDVINNFCTFCFFPSGELTKVMNGLRLDLRNNCLLGLFKLVFILGDLLQ